MTTPGLRRLSTSTAPFAPVDDGTQNGAVSPAVVPRLPAALSLADYRRIQDVTAPTRQGLAGGAALVSVGLAALGANEASQAVSNFRAGGPPPVTFRHGRDSLAFLVLARCYAHMAAVESQR